ncbi:MAG: hypothetical protein LH468_09730 [Nocardioides sp.]|nr:hypothetical protein [Nocardioides sp.]
MRSPRRVWRSPRRAIALLVFLALSAVLVPTADTAVAREGGRGDRIAATDRAAQPAQQRRSTDLLFGAYVEGMQAEPSRLSSFEELVGAPADIASYYYGYGDVFPAAAEAGFASNGRRVLVSWDMGPTRFSSWTSGEHDAYLDQIVAAALSYPADVYVRPWPEMNGDWQTFQPSPDGERPDGGTYLEFQDAWRHVVDYTRARGATNLKWVFNPAADTYAETTPVRRIWPGAEYVDVLGIDGFNWGKDRGTGRWRSFREIFAPMYRRLSALHPTAPVWICEFASKEPRSADGAPRDDRHSKARWLEDAFRSALSMGRIQAMVYFHERKERDWRVNSTPGALLALRRTVS